MFNSYHWVILLSRCNMKYEQMIVAPKKGLIVGIELCPHAGTKLDVGVSRL